MKTAVLEITKNESSSPLERSCFYGYNQYDPRLDCNLFSWIVVPRQYLVVWGAVAVASGGTKKSGSDSERRDRHFPSSS